jgi:hypothetical protein
MLWPMGLSYTIVPLRQLVQIRFKRLNPADVSVTNNDNDVAGVTVSPTS